MAIKRCVRFAVGMIFLNLDPERIHDIVGLPNSSRTMQTAWFILHLRYLIPVLGGPQMILLMSRVTPLYSELLGCRLPWQLAIAQRSHWQDERR
jgi:hypothetical protein